MLWHEEKKQTLHSSQGQGGGMSAEVWDRAKEEVLATLTDEQLRAELEHREFIRERTRHRLWTGELEAPDADGVETMRDHQ
jgi:hypothetical protein